MNKPPSKKEAVIERISRLEVLITRLGTDHSAATYHQNELVGGCVEKSKKSLKKALDSLLSNDVDEANRMAGIAWLYFSLGRKVIDADTIEHLLGESEYLELTEGRSQPEIQLERDFGQFEEMILKLRALATDQMKVS
jgi:hypothetical protein